MRRTYLRRKTVLLLLAAALAAPLTAAAVPRPDRPRLADAVETAPRKLLSRAWSFLWSIWTKEGCGIDPNGLCQGNPALELEAADEGCHIDPNGPCHS